MRHLSLSLLFSSTPFPPFFRPSTPNRNIDFIGSTHYNHKGLGFLYTWSRSLIVQIAHWNCRQLVCNYNNVYDTRAIDSPLLTNTNGRGLSSSACAEDGWIQAPCPSNFQAVCHYPYSVEIWNSTTAGGVTLIEGIKAAQVSAATLLGNSHTNVIHSASFPGQCPVLCSSLKPVQHSPLLLDTLLNAGTCPPYLVLHVNCPTGMRAKRSSKESLRGYFHVPATLLQLSSFNTLATLPRLIDFLQLGSTIQLSGLYSSQTALMLQVHTGLDHLLFSTTSPFTILVSFNLCGCVVPARASSLLEAHRTNFQSIPFHAGEKSPASALPTRFRRCY